MSWNCLVSLSFGRNAFKRLYQYYVAVHLSLSVFFLATASINLSTSSSLRNTNFSLAEFLAVFSGVLFEAIGNW